MLRVPARLVILTSLFCLGLGASAAAESSQTSVTLDGEKLGVFFNDGDSFRTVKPYSKLKVRIVDYNTLESYGPVHKWGEWTPWELYDLSKKATETAKAGSWTCERLRDRDGKALEDHYGRNLIRCSDLAQKLISEGLAHAFFMNEADVIPELMEVQRKAIAEKRGMWAKGTPRKLMTSVHSADESPDKPDWQAYNRAVDPVTGIAAKIEHSDTYGVCAEACVEDSCMIYVPFKSRYGKDRPECMRWKKQADGAKTEAPDNAEDKE
jgi:endonuclease YncB( thermonuclease family)